MDEETNKPSQGTLKFIRVLLSHSLDEQQAMSLEDDEIGWIVPLVEHELFKLKNRDVDVTILCYGLFGRKPLSYEKVGMEVYKSDPLTSAQVSQIIEHATNTLGRTIKTMNRDERNLYALLAGKEGATPVLDTTSKLMTVSSLMNICDCLKWIQFKLNVQDFISEKREQLDEQFTNKSIYTCRSLLI